MTKLITLCIATTLLATACSSNKEPSCEDVFEHTKSLAPAELKGMLDKQKPSAIEKCGKLSAEAKRCAMDASSMESLKNCSRG